MRLFARYSRINLLATVLVFLLSGIAYYFLLQYVLVNQVDEDLKIEQHEIETYTAKYQHLPEIIPVKDQRISYTLVDGQEGEGLAGKNDSINGRGSESATGKKEAGEIVDKHGNRRWFSTTRLQEGRKKKFFRQVLFYVHTNEHSYRVSVSKSLDETDDMLKSIITITFITILLMLAVTLLINRIVLRNLWKPFYATLAAIRNFELGKKGKLSLPPTTIDEFSVMNDTLKQAIEKADQDYRHLKEFTENASHELQTPVAIIQSKLDLLIQDEHLSEPQSLAVQSAYEALLRLSRLNQGLLLLTKMENGQYNDTTSILLASKIEDKLTQFEEIMEARGLTVEKDLDERVSFPLNAVLADILLNNLLSNAIKYNVTGGIITISLKKGRLDIGNTGTERALGEEAFRRFGRVGQAGDGVGLGLAIVKQAAAVSGLDLQYVYRDRRHHFVLATEGA